MESFIYRLFSEEQVAELIKLQNEITSDYLEMLAIDSFASPCDDELIESIGIFLQQNGIEHNSKLTTLISKEIYQESI
jgi:hypothetical protein